MENPLYTNALSREQSPYLLQHAHNPVDWLPWSAAAIAKAKAEDKPIFLSIGYSACHWCHVMERESFENEAVAKLLNDHFVSIKVDREELPDVDHYYMQAVVGMTGGGGWPLSVFLTPELKPFYGGTYWPPQARYGRPGFPDVLKSVFEAWTIHRDEIVASAGELAASLHVLVAARVSDGELSDELFELAAQSARSQFDSVNGGFGQAPKFPHSMELALLLRIAARKHDDDVLQMVTQSLQQMAKGGIFDQIGGGFHRYSVDSNWLVPHFEKMLYDNALLVSIYLDAFSISGNPDFLRVARSTLDWVIREMELSGGGFASSLDADSEGSEGRYYVWTPEQIDRSLGSERGARFSTAFDVTQNGNFEQGLSILNLLTSPAEKLYEQSEQDKADLLKDRSQRVQPFRDEKVLTDWNGLMISALAKGFGATGDEAYLSSAQKAADRLLKPFETTGKLIHSHTAISAPGLQLLLDYSALANGLIDLFAADSDPRWLKNAEQLVVKLDSLFRTPEGQYCMSAGGTIEARIVDAYDSALPSGISLACISMVKLYAITGNEWFLHQAESQLKLCAGFLRQAPEAFSQTLLAVDSLLHPPGLLVMVGDALRMLWQTAQRVHVPGLICLWISPAYIESPSNHSTMDTLLQGKVAVNGKPTAYLCKNFICGLPITSAEQLEILLVNAAKQETI